MTAADRHCHHFSHSAKVHENQIIFHETHGPKIFFHEGLFCVLHTAFSAFHIAGSRYLLRKQEQQLSSNGVKIMNSASALLPTGQVRVELCLMSSDHSDLSTIARARISVNRHCKYFVHLSGPAFHTIAVRSIPLHTRPGTSRCTKSESATHPAG